MKTFFSSAGICFLGGAIAGIAWLLLMAMGTGSSNPVEVYALAGAGVVFAAITGFVLGRNTPAGASYPGIVLGWLLALLTTPAAMITANPCNSVSDRGEGLILLVLYLAAGIASTSLSRRHARATG